VIASVDTYMRFAEAVNRLDLTETETQGLPELLEGITESGSKGKTTGALEAVKEKLTGGGDDSDEDSNRSRSSDRPRRRRSREDEESDERPRRRREPAKRSDR
jgi:hypothetical protein